MAILFHLGSKIPPLFPWRSLPGVSPSPPPGPLALADNCVFTPTMGGLSDFSVAAAVPGSMTPQQAGCVTGSRYHYAARSADQTQWEIGIGTCWGQYIARTSVLWSSNNNQPVNFTVVPTVAL